MNAEPTQKKLNSLEQLEAALKAGRLRRPTTEG